MKLQFVYLLIGILTLISNLVLTIHIIGRNPAVKFKEPWEREEPITFKLTSISTAASAETVAASYDNTESIE